MDPISRVRVVVPPCRYRSVGRRLGRPTSDSPGGPVRSNAAGSPSTAADSREETFRPVIARRWRHSVLQRPVRRSRVGDSGLDGFRVGMASSSRPPSRGTSRSRWPLATSVRADSLPVAIMLAGTTAVGDTDKSQLEPERDESTHKFTDATISCCTGTAGDNRNWSRGARQCVEDYSVLWDSTGERRELGGSLQPRPVLGTLGGMNRSRDRSQPH